MKHEHVLVVGGTGMLKGVTLRLSQHCRSLTLVARSLVSVRPVTNEFSPGCEAYELAASWDDSAAFVEAVHDHVAEVGAPSMVVAWVHESALGLRLAQMLAESGSACDFFQLRGSSAADPSKDPTKLGGGLPAHMRFHQVVLGFQIEESGSRWLRHDEIVAGTLEAIERAQEVFVVGTVRPWSMRP
ncbi:MAG: hypothetical protein ACJAYU_000831 [Bradymonadia bacterium]